MLEEPCESRPRPERQAVAVSSEEALRREVADIVVHEDEETVLTPKRREFARHFARVRLRRFSDLQALGLVPRQIEEQTVRSAIAADDEDALRLAKELVVRRPQAVSSCDCHSQAAAGAVRFDRDLKSHYLQVRQSYHPALAKQLSGHYGTTFSFDSVFAATVRQWTRRLEARAVIEVSLVQDITIGRGATLVLSDDTSVLLARSIRIHRSGKLIHRGGFLRVWATSITSFLIELSDVVDSDESIVWRLSA